MGSLYVGDLRTDVGEFDLLRIFNAVGKISSIHVCRDTETKKSLGYAYVNYCERRSAENALIQLNYWNIKGKSCRVMWSHHAKELNITEGGNVFVKNLHKEICNKDLHEIFSAFGKIISCKVAMNKQQQSLGYGYVHFERVVDAERAIKKANRMSINGKEVHVEYFRCKGERIQQNTTKESQPTHSNLPQENRTNLYVNNLDTKINDGMLEGLFLRFGKITSAKIERNQYNVSKQFGFVCFLVPNAATEAIEEMNGSTICDRLIYVGYAQKKSERKEFLSQQFNTSRAGPAKYTPNPDVAHRKQSLTDSKQKYCLPKRHSFSTSDVHLRNDQGPVKTRSATNSASTQSPIEITTPKTRTQNTVTETGIRKVPRPITLTSNVLPLRQRSRILSLSSERLFDHVSSVKIRSVPSSPTREFSQNFPFEQQTKDPLTPYGSSQIPNVEENAINIFEQKTQFREPISPQKSERVENVQDLIPSKDPISPNKLSSGGTSWRKTIPNYDDHGLQQRTAHKVIHEMRMDIRTVEEKIYDTASKEYPNEANLIVRLITEKCNKEQLQLIANSDSLLDNEVEKARSKIRVLETPMCQNYA